VASSARLPIELGCLTTSTVIHTAGRSYLLQRRTPAG
jgi:hypothetical protein